MMKSISLLKRDPFNHPTVMYRKSFLNKIGGYSDYRKNQDTDLWIRMLESGAKTKNLDEIVFKFRFEQNTFEKRKTGLTLRRLFTFDTMLGNEDLIVWAIFRNNSRPNCCLHLASKFPTIFI